MDSFQVVFEYQFDTIPFEVNGKQYSEYRTFRVAVLGDVGTFIGVVLIVRCWKNFPATNLPPKKRKSLLACYQRVLFCFGAMTLVWIIMKSC